MGKTPHEDTLRMIENFGKVKDQINAIPDEEWPDLIERFKSRRAPKTGNQKFKQLIDIVKTNEFYVQRAVTVLAEWGIAVDMFRVIDYIRNPRARLPSRNEYLQALAKRDDKKLRELFLNSGSDEAIALSNTCDKVLGSGSFGYVCSVGELIVKAEIKAISGFNIFAVSNTIGFESDNPYFKPVNMVGEAFLLGMIHDELAPEFTRHIPDFYSCWMLTPVGSKQTRSRIFYAQTGKGDGTLPSCTKEEAKSVLDQLEVVLRELHRNGYVHNDLNTGNIMWKYTDQKEIVYSDGTRIPTHGKMLFLIDFGKGQKLSEGRYPRVIYDSVWEEVYNPAKPFDIKGGVDVDMRALEAHRKRFADDSEEDEDVRSVGYSSDVIEASRGRKGLSKSQLQELLRKKGLPITGNKDELVDRLLNA